MAQEAQSSFELCWIFFTTLSNMSYDRWHRKHRTFELSWTPKKSTTLRGIVSETLTLRTLRLKSQAQVGQWIPPNKRGRTPKCSASWGIVSDTHSIKSQASSIEPKLGSGFLELSGSSPMPKLGSGLHFYVTMFWKLGVPVHPRSQGCGTPVWKSIFYIAVKM